MKPEGNRQLDPISDTAIMLKVKAGDIDKLGLLYERHHRMLFAFFWRMSGRHVESEDLIQEVFYRILKNRTKYKGKGKFSSWMFQIAHNVWADHYKKHHTTDLKDDMEGWDLHDGLGADEQIEKEEQLRQLRAALNALPGDRREVLILSRYHGMKYSEIAKISGSTEGAVKLKVYRAMADLREQFSKTENR